MESRGVNVVELIEERMVAGDQALWMGGEVMSYGELFGRVGRLAERLRAWAAWPRVGVPRVGLLADNGTEYVLVALAVLKAGGCFVPVAGELVGPEREELARTTALEFLEAATTAATAGGPDFSSTLIAACRADVSGWSASGAASAVTVSGSHQ